MPVNEPEQTCQAPKERMRVCGGEKKNVAAIDNTENQREDFSWFLTEIVVFSPLLC